MASHLLITRVTGGRMKTQSILMITISITALSLLTACGASKSNQSNQSSVVANAQYELANCSRLTNNNVSYNIATAIDSNSGKINPDWIKIKFNFLSTEMTQSGYSVKFYKWRVIGSSAQLDPIALSFSTYNLTTGQSGSELVSGVYTTSVTNQFGYYVQLNDDTQYPYQALKVVIYKADGTVAAQSDVLIPQFAASPIEYKKNSDGSVRAENLQRLHPLYSTDVSAWTPDQLKQNFDQYCF